MEKITNEMFNDLQWHDAVIDNILIDRSSPGTSDTIEIFITWNDERKSGLLFQNVYLVELNMNFGIVASESILYAVAKGNDSTTVQDLYNRVENLMDGVCLNHYDIRTNSTNSTISIVAETIILSNYD